MAERAGAVLFAANVANAVFDGHGRSIAQSDSFTEVADGLSKLFP
jgi:hypothetical protein